MSACIPVVQHTPRVAPGFGMGLTASVGGRAVSAPDEESCASSEPRPTPHTCYNYRYDEWFPTEGYAAPAVHLALMHGWAPTDSTRPSFAVGVQLPYVVGVAATEFDLFMQLPERSVRHGAAGVGIIASIVQMMPYVQYGRYDASGGGWHTTQGVYFLPEDNEIAWAPAFTVTQGSRNADARRIHTLSLHIGGAVGTRSYRVVHERDGVTAAETQRQAAWRLYVAAGWNYSRRRPRRGRVRPCRS